MAKTYNNKSWASVHPFFVSTIHAYIAIFVSNQQWTPFPLVSTSIWLQLIYGSGVGLATITRDTASLYVIIQWKPCSLCWYLFMSHTSQFIFDCMMNHAIGWLLISFFLQDKGHIRSNGYIERGDVKNPSSSPFSWLDQKIDIHEKRANIIVNAYDNNQLFPNHPLLRYSHMSLSTKRTFNKMMLYRRIIKAVQSNNMMLYQKI